MENKNEFTSSDSRSEIFLEEEKNRIEEILDKKEEIQNVWAKNNPTVYGRAKTAIEEFIRKRSE